MENDLKKLLPNFEHNSTVGSKVMALLSCYSCLARKDLLFNEWGFQTYYKENVLRILLSNFKCDPTVGSKVMAL